GWSRRASSSSCRDPSTPDSVAGFKFLARAPLQCSTSHPQERAMTHKIDGGAPIARPTEVTTRPLATTRSGSADRGAPVAATESVRLTGEAEGLQALERELGAGPAGIDVARVNAL